MPANGGADCVGQGQETAECEASGEIEYLIESFLHDNTSQTWRPPPRTPSASFGAGGPPGAPPLPAVPSASQQRPGPAPTRPRTISRWDKMRRRRRRRCEQCVKCQACKISLQTCDGDATSTSSCTGGSCNSASSGEVKSPGEF